MSVIVKRLKSTSMEVYVKGAPEVMAEICDKSSCKRLRDFHLTISFDVVPSQSHRITMTFCHITPSVGTVSSPWQARASKDCRG